MNATEKNQTEKEKCCCIPLPKDIKQHFSGCLICGKPLEYFSVAREQTCSICGQTYLSNCRCEVGHFVCDTCHESSSIAEFVPWLLSSAEKDPLKLLEEIMSLPQIHMHGPEHHVIVPCVLLTAYYNNGGELNLTVALKEAVRRAKQVPGGICGYWGVCGAAAGAGIYFSILLGSNPVHKEAWPIPQYLVSECLHTIADVGGPRCCKRTSRLAIRCASDFTRDWLGIDFPAENISCSYMGRNKECLGQDCPFFPQQL